MKPFRWPLAPAFAIAALVALAGISARAQQVHEDRLDGFNVIVSPGHPFGSDSAKQALANAKRAGARAVAVVPFFWQASPTSPDLVRGKDMSDDELSSAIRDAHALGLAVVVKPHVWVPNRWAGTIVMTSDRAWQKWFDNYRRELSRIALVAEMQGAEALAFGTELSQTTQRPEWEALIGDTRGIYSGRLFYVAHNVEEAEKVPFWQELDAVGVSLYPPLGSDCDRDGWRMTMRAVADRLDVLATRTGKPIIVAEVGLRSAQGAAAKPWESPEERASNPAPALQAEALLDWLSVLDRPSVKGVLIWRWLTDPDAGGMTDTDFTVQGKTAEHELMCAWAKGCDTDDSKVAAH
jgi:hypothetical protein